MSLFFVTVVHMLSNKGNKGNNETSRLLTCPESWGLQHIVFHYSYALRSSNFSFCITMILHQFTVCNASWASLILAESQRPWVERRTWFVSRILFEGPNVWNAFQNSNLRLCRLYWNGLLLTTLHFYFTMWYSSSNILLFRITRQHWRQQVISTSFPLTCWWTYS